MFNQKLLSNFLLKSPLMAALFTQVIVALVLRNFILWFKIPLSIQIFVIFHAVSCTLVTQLILKLPKWFTYISFFLPILITVAFNYLHISSMIYGAIFLILALTFSHTLFERVPLYLSNNSTHIALADLINKNRIRNFLDLGSGFGGVVRATSSKNVNAVGVESAPLVWFVSKLLSFIFGKGNIIRKNIWNTNCSEFEMVFAFLSPAIMEKLYLKLKNEMKPNSIFISNSFEIHSTKYNELIILNDSRQTKLFIYKIN